VRAALVSGIGLLTADGWLAARPRPVLREPVAGEGERPPRWRSSLTRRRRLGAGDVELLLPGIGHPLPGNEWYGRVFYTDEITKAMDFSRFRKSKVLSALYMTIRARC
jgi:hypothetical protein